MQSKSFSLNIDNKIEPFIKSIKVDSDKSLSIRGFLIGSISQNVSSLKNVLESEDVLSAILALKKLDINFQNTYKKLVSTILVVFTYCFFKTMSRLSR